MSDNPYTGPAVRCAGPNCEQVKKETNHWFVVRIAAGFECYRFNEASAMLSDHMPVCGQSCAQKLFEQYLSEGK